MMENKKNLFIFILLGSICFYNSYAARSAAVSHRVGDCYGGGIIYYLNKAPNVSAGKHGLIVALTDVAGSSSWDTKIGSQNIPDTQTSLFAGDSNTKTIIKAIGVTRAEAASDTQKYTDGTYHDWYLPTKSELTMLYFQMLAVGKQFWSHCDAEPLSAATYWSSTQNNPTNASAVSFAGGIVVSVNKNEPLLVRAVRAF